MPVASNPHPTLTLIRGGKITNQQFARLPFQEKLLFLRHQPAKKRLELLVGDAEGKSLTRALQPQELYWIVREVGETDSVSLFELASPEQYTFMLDMELWEKWSFSSQKAVAWVEYLVTAGEEKVMEQLPCLDFEMLLLLFKSQISVAGGIGDLVNDEQRLSDWDHTFDNIFHITFIRPENSRIIGTLLDIVYRNDHTFYVAIMTGVQSELDSELEELSWQFRTGRLADMGFPSLDEAVSIYTVLDPSTFVPAEDKVLRPDGQFDNLPQPVALKDLLLQRALALAGSPELHQELNYLINNALVAEGTAFADEEGLETVCDRVYGYLNVALEFLAGTDEEKAAGILRGERFVRLFRLGHSLVVRLRKRGEKLTSDNYAVNKVLLGLKGSRPNYYRGLDPDRADGYREFRGMDDILRVEDFLRSLEV